MKQTSRTAKIILQLGVFTLVAGIVFQACKKNEDAPYNPYSDIDYGNTVTTDTIDPRSFPGIHKKIIATKCAMPGCHDGNFEPDFRTVQSSYTTLVYHPVVKKLSPWIYRVMPYDTANSWLWQRLNHQTIISGPDTSSGQMPLYSTPLSQTELNNISYWIMNGARDMFGQLPVLPNSEPSVIGYIAAKTYYPYARLDSTRIGGLYYNPFLVPDSVNSMLVAVALADDSTLVSNLTNNTLKLSDKADDFSAAQTFSGVYFSAFSAWLYTVNTSMYSPNDTIFMRVYTNDGDHIQDTEFPRNDLLLGYKTYWSFVITP